MKAPGFHRVGATREWRLLALVAGERSRPTFDATDPDCDRQEWFAPLKEHVASWLGVEESGRPGLTTFTYTAEPGAKSRGPLNLAGSWAATLDQPEATDATDPA